MRSINRKKLAWIWIGLLTLFPVCLWLADSPLDTRFSSSDSFLLSLGQVSGLMGTALYSITLILSARLKVFEKIFYGLNEVYEKHSQLGQLALMLLLVHPLMLLPMYASTFNDAAAFFLPSEDWAQNWGQFSLGLMILLIVLTLYLRPRYNIWKWTHKFLGLAFFLGALHVWLIPSDTAWYVPLRLYMLVLAGIGLVAFLYRTVFGSLLVNTFRYEISQVNILNDSVTELSLKPLSKPLVYKPGQFLFIKFPKSPLGSEGHPYSIVSTPDESEIRLVIKNLGDYTGKLRSLQVGQSALIEGPFGVFSNEGTQYKDQIWVAGGIGITPFLSLAKALKDEGAYHVDLFYCVKEISEVVYRDLLEAIALQPSKGLRLHIFCSDKNGRMDAEHLQTETGHLSSKDILLCAPPAMIHALKKQLIEKKVPSELIHSEEFNF